MSQRALTCDVCGKGFCSAQPRARFCSVKCGRKERYQRERGPDTMSREEQFAKYQRDREDLIRDVLLLLPVEPPNRLAERLGYSLRYLKEKLHRIGRDDLAEAIRREEDRYYFGSNHLRHRRYEEEVA